MRARPSDRSSQGASHADRMPIQMHRTYFRAPPAWTRVHTEGPDILPARPQCSGVHTEGPDILRPFLNVRPYRDSGHTSGPAIVFRSPYRGTGHTSTFSERTSIQRFRTYFAGPPCTWCRFLHYGELRHRSHPSIREVPDILRPPTTKKIGTAYRGTGHT
jgi:hypothetical protein